VIDPRCLACSHLDPGPVALGQNVRREPAGSLSTSLRRLDADKKRRLAARRREQETDVLKERYAMRSGIESTNRGLKNRLGLGRLCVRARGSVFRVIWHKLAGWNVLRAAASEKMRAWVAEQMARMLKSGGSAPPLGRVLVLFCGWMSIAITFSGMLDRCPTVSALFRRPERKNRPPHAVTSVRDVKNGFSVFWP